MNMSVSLDPDVRDRLDALVDELRGDGSLRSPEWERAFRAVPRHLFVPRLYAAATDRRGITIWRPLDSADRTTWLEAIYSDETLVTGLDAATAAPTGDGAFTGVATSSSSQPSLMARMLEDLDLHDGHRVLEIGTGTGYNAALLAHRLGAGQVCTIDIDPSLADAARARLIEGGYGVTVVAGDGRDGLAPGAPYDRIIATCSVPAIPPAWIEQTRPGGVILADVATEIEGGLVRLTVDDTGRAEGCFTAGTGRFMPARTSAGTYGERARAPYAPPSGTRPSPVVAADVLGAANYPLRLLLAARLPEVELVYDCDENTGAVALQLQQPDGTWARGPLPGQPGEATITWGGGHDLWRGVESAVRWWNSNGRPDHTRFGIIATAEGTARWHQPPEGDRVLLHQFCLPER